MNCKIIKVGEKEYNFRITNRSQVEIEKRIGPMLAAINRVTEAEVMVAIIWGALYPLNHEVTYDKAYDILDQMVDDGTINGTEKRVDFIMELLEVSGFLSQEEIKEMKRVTDQEKKKAMKKLQG